MSVLFANEKGEPTFRDEINIRPITEFKNEFHIEKKLGAGAFAEVYRAERRNDNADFAVKIIDRSQATNPQRIWAEVRIQQKLDHPNIIKLFKTFADKYHVVLILEFARGGELYEKLLENESYAECDAVNIIKHTLQALEYLHENGIVHRDVKPENILFADKEDKNPKLGDFGLSGIMKENSLMNTCAGTPIFMAPEVIKGTGYNTSCDLWSVGVMTYLLLTGKLPFNGENPYNLFKEICSAKFEFCEEFNVISDEAKSFIKKLIVLDPAKRYTAAEALKDPWLDVVNETPLVKSRGLVLNFLEERRKLREYHATNMAISFIGKLKYKAKSAKSSPREIHPKGGSDDEKRAKTDDESSSQSDDE